MQLTPPLLSTVDERFTHQRVAPHLETMYSDPAWGDRCYHLLHAPGFTLNAGRQLYVNDKRRYAFCGVATDNTQHCLRVQEAFETGDDPDQSRLGGISIEVVRPMQEIRIVVDDPNFAVAADLTFRTRFAPVASDPHIIEQAGQVVTHYMNFFQSGSYSGKVTIDGVEHALDNRHGFRDRGWGLRKHEGMGRRGFIAACFCELRAEAIYLILYETASGHRVFTNGWFLDETGVKDIIVAVEHDLHFDDRLLHSGQFRLRCASGRTATVRLEVERRLYLSGIGYAREERFTRPGLERFDLTDAPTVSVLNGQNDNGCTFSVDGARGHGYVETGLGIHARYRPAPPDS